MSNFFIYNKNRERIGMLQNYNSVQWLENYQSPGEVKIDAPITDDNLAMLIDGNRISNTDTDTSAKICNVEIIQDENTQSIIVRANITSQLLNERVVMSRRKVKNIELSMYAIYAENKRGLPISTEFSKGYSESTEMEIRWGSVLEAEQKLAELSGLGFKIVFNPETGEETLRVYKGVNRADESDDNYIGYFSTDIGNIKNSSIISDSKDYKNVAIVEGAGEGAEKIVRTVSMATFSGEDMREVYVDAKNIKREYQEEIDTEEYDEEGNPIYNYETKTYTDEEYNAILDNYGLEKLLKTLKQLSIHCDIEQNNMIYGIDYNLGDLIPIKLPTDGTLVRARISSVTMIYEREGNKISAVLSDFELKIKPIIYTNYIK